MDGNLEALSQAELVGKLKAYLAKQSQLESHITRLNDDIQRCEYPVQCLLQKNQELEAEASALQMQHEEFTERNRDSFEDDRRFLGQLSHGSRGGDIYHDVGLGMTGIGNAVRTYDDYQGDEKEDRIKELQIETEEYQQEIGRMQDVVEGLNHDLKKIKRDAASDEEDYDDDDSDGGVRSKQKYYYTSEITSLDNEFRNYQHEVEDQRKGQRQKDRSMCEMVDDLKQDLEIYANRQRWTDKEVAVQHSELTALGQRMMQESRKAEVNWKNLHILEERFRDAEISESAMAFKGAAEKPNRDVLDLDVLDCATPQPPPASEPVVPAGSMSESSALEVQEVGVSMKSSLALAEAEAREIRLLESEQKELAQREARRRKELEREMVRTLQAMHNVGANLFTKS